MDGEILIRMSDTCHLWHRSVRTLQARVDCRSVRQPSGPGAGRGCRDAGARGTIVTGVRPDDSRRRDRSPAGLDIGGNVAEKRYPSYLLMNGELVAYADAK